MILAKTLTQTSINSDFIVKYWLKNIHYQFSIISKILKIKKRNRYNVIGSSNFFYLITEILFKKVFYIFLNVLVAFFILALYICID